jgi:hypothetical protein
MPNVRSGNSRTAMNPWPESVPAPSPVPDGMPALKVAALAEAAGVEPPVLAGVDCPGEPSVLPLVAVLSLLATERKAPLFASV